LSIIARYTSYYPIAFLAVLLGYFIYRATGAPFSDYAGYYFGSKVLLQGNYQQVYDTYSLNAMIAEKGFTGVFVSYTPFPPFTSIVVAPFLLLPVAASKIVFNVFSATLFIRALTRTVKYFSIPGRVVWLIPILFFIPLRNNIFFGQAYLLLFALLMEGFMAYKKEKPIVASLLWGVAIVFKLFPLVVVFFLLVKKEYKQALYCIIACTVLGLVSVAFNGFTSWQYYVFTIFPRANSGELNNSYTYLFQSAFMLMKNLFVYDEVQNPQVLINSMPLFIIIMALFKAAVLACCVGLTLQKKTTSYIAFAGWITASLLLSPNGSSYSLILLLIPLLALANSKAVYVYAGMALVFLICFIPVQALAKWPLLLQFPRLYLMLLFFALIYLVAAPSRSFGKAKPGARFPLKTGFAFFALLLLVDIPKLFAPKDNSVYLFKQKLPLVYDYTIKNNRLVYYYWDEKGRHETITNYAVQDASTDEVYIQNNQLYYKDQQLTATPDRKQEIMLINNTDIVYLSDKGRGFKFYTLRRIPKP
jgi:hypothetical protein